jgi:hypothetical protein
MGGNGDGLGARSYTAKSFRGAGQRSVYLVLLPVIACLLYTIATTERQIRRSLAEEEARDAARGVLPPHKVTPSSFLNTGLDLEEQQ